MNGEGVVTLAKVTEQLRADSASYVKGLSNLDLC